MHNAATSFDNVLRGLGHWATFVSFGGRAYFPWAASYASGLFGALLWFVPIVALGGIAFKRNQRPATLFFLIVTIVSVPIVVGYYHDALGDAVTTPIYDRVLPELPGIPDVPLFVQVGRGRRVRHQRTLRASPSSAIVGRCANGLPQRRTRERAGLGWTVPAAGCGVDRSFRS